MRRSSACGMLAVAAMSKAKQPSRKVALLPGKKSGPARAEVRFAQPDACKRGCEAA